MSDIQRLKYFKTSMELDPMIDLIKLHSMYCQPQNLTKTKRDLVLLLYYLTDSGNKLKNQS